MKLFRLIGTMTVVAAVAATMAVSASAYTASYETGKVTVTGAEAQEGVNYTAVVTNVVEGALTEDDYLQIEQAAELGELKVADLEAGKYYVRIGGVDAAAYDTVAFAVTKTDAVTASGFENAENADDAAVAWFAVENVEVPAGLVPYWTNGSKKKAAVADMANIEGGISLGLTIAGAESADYDMSVVWDLAE